ncbi:MAG: HAD family phosphatase [Eubacteriales bacterium]|nr:HAD family phosphatase [Eubacteriales bacterium]
MIKNIVFDMGNVLLDFNPEVCLHAFAETEEDRAVIRKELFGGPEWIEGDRGTLKNAEKFAPVSRRVPERLHAALQKCVDEWDMCMKPVPGAREFCAYAKENGYGIYVLSNADDRFPHYFPRFQPYDYFDGILVSSDVRLIKPDVRIYQHFLEKFGLRAEKCLFLDDRAENVEGAKKAGMQGMQFLGNFEEIKNSLKRNA